MINTKKLHEEIIGAAIDISGCNEDGVVWGPDGSIEIQDQPAVAAIIAAHDPNGLTKNEQAKINAKTNADVHNGSDVKNLGVPDLNDIIRVLCAEHGWVDENGIIEIPN